MAQYVAVRSLLRRFPGRVVGTEVVRVKVDATAGQFKLTFGGQTTADIAFNAAASAVQTAFVALSTVGAGNASVSGGPGNSGGTTPYYIVFTGTLGNKNVGTVGTAAGTTPLSGGGAAATVTVTNQGGPQTLSPTLDSIVDLDVADNRRALGHHSAVGQYIVSGTNAAAKGVVLPANS